MTSNPFADVAPTGTDELLPVETFEGAVPPISRNTPPRAAGPKHVDVLKHGGMSFLATLEPGQKLTTGGIAPGVDAAGKARFVILGHAHEVAETAKRLALKVANYVDSHGRKMRIMTRQIKHPSTGADVIAAWRSHCE